MILMIQLSNFKKDAGTSIQEDEVIVSTIPRQILPMQIDTIKAGIFIAIDMPLVRIPETTPTANAANNAQNQLT